jgi:serine/threonine protein kinase
MGSQRELLGKTIGSSHLLRFLGEGFGEVYSAEQVYLGTLGAVKILSLRGDQQVRDLIRAEARISAQLRHPHLIPMVDFALRRRCRIW